MGQSAPTELACTGRMRGGSELTQVRDACAGKASRGERGGVEGGGYRSPKISPFDRSVWYMYGHGMTRLELFRYRLWLREQSALLARAEEDDLDSYESQEV